MRRLYLIQVMLFTFLQAWSQVKDYSFSVCDFAPVAIAAIDAPFAMETPKKPEFNETTYNILDFGAQQTEFFRIDSSLKRAIDKATANGGGKIIIPGGIWESGPIYLKSNIELHLETGAEVFFSTNLSDYLPAVFSRHQGIECYKFSSLIYANGEKNIAITGNGILHGQGKGWWKHNNKREKAWDTLVMMADKNVSVSQRVFDDTVNRFLAPSFIQPINCENLFIEGITVMFGPFWTINPVYCENIIIRKVKVITTGLYGHTKNGDGINLSSCKRALIEYCDLSTGDDCITLKSGRDADGMRVNRPTSEVVIRYCQAYEGHGGVVIGSETSGGIQNVLIKQCSFYGTDRGIRIKTARGRGAYVKNIYVSDIQMENIKNEAVVINMLRYTPRLPAHPVDKNTPEYENINIEHVHCKGAEYGIRLVGLPEKPMQNILLNNISVEANYGLEATDAQNVVINNIRINSLDTIAMRFTDCRNVALSKVQSAPDRLELNGATNTNFTFHNCRFTSTKGWLINNETPMHEIHLK